jgi:putative DNA primase/helicase
VELRKGKRHSLRQKEEWLMLRTKTIEAARGKWRGILRTFGVPEQVLQNKHGKCPLCAKDNFRFDDKQGSGSWICTCGNGTGVDLVIACSGKNYREVCRSIDGILGMIQPTALPKTLAPEQTLGIVCETYRKSEPVVPGDLVHRYLSTRGVAELICPEAFRFSSALRDGEGGIHPCMLALVGVPGEKKFSSMHRTFLRPDGSGKADMQAPRKMMPGPLPDGACIMLADYTGGPLGIAEGIETAMSASALFNIPVWSAINTAILRKWHPPADCKEVVIFADNDTKFGGQSAAWHLAHRLSCKSIAVDVRTPEKVGQDFNDVWMER